MDFVRCCSFSFVPDFFFLMRFQEGNFDKGSDANSEHQSRAVLSSVTQVNRLNELPPAPLNCNSFLIIFQTKSHRGKTVQLCPNFLGKRRILKTRLVADSCKRLSIQNQTAKGKICPSFDSDGGLNGRFRDSMRICVF